MARPDAEREAPQQSKKILRVGIFQGGKSLEERLFRKPSDVSLGQSTKNTFVVPSSAGLPKSFTLFKASPSGYALNFTDAMEGRLSLGDTVLDFSQLRQGKAQAQKDSEGWHVPLSDRARGKILVGELTILFQFVTPPPVQPRPQLPPSVRGSVLGEMDGRLALVLLGSFLCHFGFVVYLRMADFPKQPDIEEIPDRFVQVLVPKKPEQPKKEEDAPKKEERKEAKKDDGKKIAQKAEPRKEITPEEQARIAAEKRARLEAQVSQLGVLKMLTARGDGGTVADLVKGGDPGSDADKVFSSVGGVGVAGGPGGLQAVKGGGGTGLSRGIDGLRASGPGEVGTGDKGEARVRAVVRDSAPQDIEPGTLDPAAVAAKIRQYKGALVACYESALKRNPNLSGKITLRFTINKMGKVSKAEIETDTMHDDDVNRCIVERASNWRFPPPQGGGDDVQFAYPFIFQASK